jgi:hypothetical protein
VTGEKKLVSSGDCEEYAKRDSGKENRAFFQAAVTAQHQAHHDLSLHNFLLGVTGCIAIVISQKAR